MSKNIKESTNRLYHDCGNKYDNCHVTLARFPNKKIPRVLTNAIERSDLKNIHSCGLYDYIWLLCHATTFCKTSTPLVSQSAYLDIPIEKMMDAFHLKTVKMCILHLEALKEKGLIIFKPDQKNKTIHISILNRQTSYTKSNKKIKMEKSSINNARGFIFANKPKLVSTFWESNTFSESDILVFLWLYVTYNDPAYKVSMKSAVIALPEYGSYFSVRLSSYRIAHIFNCSKSRINSLLHKMQKNGFISLRQRYGRCLVIGICHYCEWLLGKKDHMLCDDDIEVDVLHRDPDPVIRDDHRKVNHCAAILKNIIYYNDNGIMTYSCFNNYNKACKQLLLHKYQRYGIRSFYHTVLYLRKKLLDYGNYCPQNRIFWHTQLKEILQLRSGFVRSKTSPKCHSFIFNK